MIICNGVVGLCLLVGSLRHHEQSFHVEGANTALATVIARPTLFVGTADLHDELHRVDLHGTATRFRGDHLAGAVGLVRVRADRAPSDYFLPVDTTNDGRPPCRAAVGSARVGELRPAPGRSARGGRSRQGALTDHRRRGDRSRRAGRRPRYRDRASGAAARNLGRTSAGGATRDRLQTSPISRMAPRSPVSA